MLTAQSLQPFPAKNLKLQNLWSPHYPTSPKTQHRAVLIGPLFSTKTLKMMVKSLYSVLATQTSSSYIFFSRSLSWQRKFSIVIPLKISPPPSIEQMTYSHLSLKTKPINLCLLWNSADILNYDEKQLQLEFIIFFIILRWRNFTFLLSKQPKLSTPTYVHHFDITLPTRYV